MISAVPPLVHVEPTHLAAHPFVLYCGAQADVTPPTRLGYCTAAGVPGAGPQRTTRIAAKAPAARAEPRRTS